MVDVGDVRKEYSEDQVNKSVAESPSDCSLPIIVADNLVKTLQILSTEKIAWNLGRQAPPKRERVITNQVDSFFVMP